MQALRHSTSLTLIALLAILVQLLLPMQHAAAMAHAGGSPLLVAFCGTASPQAMQRLRDAAPPDLIAALNLKAAQNQAQSAGDAPCSFCNGLTDLQSAALAFTLALLNIALPSTSLALLPMVMPASLRITRSPPARGPPLLS